MRNDHKIRVKFSLTKLFFPVARVARVLTRIELKLKITNLIDQKKFH